MCLKARPDKDMETIRKQLGQSLPAVLGLFLILGLAACGGEATPAASATAAPSATVVPTETAEPVPTVTTAPTARDDVETYTVQEGDTLSGIAAQFGLAPETVLWANYDEMYDNPDFLLPGMGLLILPIDGIYHQVGGGDTVTNVAAFFGAEAQAIIEWPANGIDADNPILFAGNWVLVPEGTRFSRWRQMPSVAREAADLDPDEFGSGACGADYASGPVGDGDYSPPVSPVEILGEEFTDWHPGVDLAVELGQDVQAADDGVVVFSGWSNLGYGYMVMVDHGNGDTTLYGGLGEVAATCGQQVQEGDVIGKAGITGYPAGAILHFEVRRDGEAVDPFSLVKGVQD
jgi:hypothetical protein